MGDNFNTMDEKELWNSVLNQSMPSEVIALQFLIGRLDFIWDQLQWTKLRNKNNICTKMQF